MGIGDEVPADIAEAAEKVGRWFAERNAKNWALGPCAPRTEVERLTREREDTLALYLVARNKAAAMRKALEQLISACRSADIGYLDQPIEDAEEALRGGEAGK